MADSRADYRCCARAAHPEVDNGYIFGSCALHGLIKPNDGHFMHVCKQGNIITEIAQEYVFAEILELLSRVPGEPSFVLSPAWFSCTKDKDLTANMR